MTLSSTDRTATGATAIESIDLRDRQAEPSLGDLVTQATKDLSGLVQAQLELAKAELRQDVKQAAVGGVLLGAAAFLGFLASIVLSFFLVQLLIELGVWAWAAYLIVGVVYLVLAGVLALVGKKKMQKVEPPKQTIESTKGTVAALKGQQP